MSHDPDLRACQIDLTRRLLADAVAERDRYADTPPWKPRTQRRRATAARTVEELHTLLGELEARRRPVHAIILRVNGRHHPLHEPVTDREFHLIISDTLDVATGRHPDHPDVRLVMYVDDLGHQRGLPYNMIATALYGTGWPILGDVVVTTDDDQPLADELVDSLVGR